MATATYEVQSTLSIISQEISKPPPHHPPPEPPPRKEAWWDASLCVWRWRYWLIRTTRSIPLERAMLKAKARAEIEAQENTFQSTLAPSIV